MTRACTDCSAQLGRRNTSGRCRPCFVRRNNTEPAIIAARRAGLAAYYDAPGVREIHARRCADRNRDITEAERESRRAHGRRQAATVLSRPEIRAHIDSPAVRARAGRSRTETVLGWCPPELRNDYRLLQRNGFPADEARRIIEARIDGSLEHARRLIETVTLTQRLRVERERMEAY